MFDNTTITYNPWELCCHLQFDRDINATCTYQLVLHINPYAAGGKFGQYKMMQKTWKITETLACGYSPASAQQELSDEYQNERV